MNGGEDNIYPDEEVPILLNLGSPSADTPVSISTDRTSDECSSAEVPVTILTGFLGSGKTTLIQYILRSEDHGKKIAIIENEFSGASAAIGGGNQYNSAEKEGLSIETLIARDGTNNSNLTDLIELPNGCICCTVKDSLVETLETLLNKKKELDYIIIECSGMANPGPIASIFWLDDALESRLRLDGIVACVDAKNFEMQLAETSSVTKSAAQNDNLQSSQNICPGGDEAAQQVAYADRIILNKIDLLDGSKDHIEQVVQQIRAINASAPIVTTKYSQVGDLNWILDAKCFDMERVREVENTFTSIDNDTTNSSDGDQPVCIDRTCLACLTSSAERGRHLYCSPCDHIHTMSIRTVALVENGSVDLKKLNTWLASILWPDQDEDDCVLKAELEELERINQITIPTMTEKRRINELKNKMCIFRIKGFISVHNSDNGMDEDQISNYQDKLDQRKYIVQAVNDLWDITPATEYWKQNDIRQCKLVIIGRNLEQEQLLSGFQSCISIN